MLKNVSVNIIKKEKKEKSARKTKKKTTSVQHRKSKSDGKVVLDQCRVDSSPSLFPYKQTRQCYIGEILPSLRGGSPVSVTDLS